MSTIPKLPSIYGITKDPTEYYIKKKKDPLAYLRKPPLIKPNFGKPHRSLLPKTKISHVLLYDNTTQEQLLDVQLKYIQHQRRRVRRLIQINQQKFHFRQEKRAHHHNRMQEHYQSMKDAFIAQFGTRYMPVPKVEAEVDPFLINAQLVPVLNVLCYFLEQKEEQAEKKKKRKDKTGKHSANKDDAKPTCDSKRVAAETDVQDGQIGTDRSGKDSRKRAHMTEIPVLYTNSVEDPRFRSLEEALEPPSSEGDGYLQLSPTYCKDTRPSRRIKPYKDRVIPLPNFYRRNRSVSPGLDDEAVIDMVEKSTAVTSY